jgi:hypothetical protein
MKQTLKYYAMAACVAGLAVSYSCSDDDGPSDFKIASAMAGDKDLNGGTPPEGVAQDAALVLTFNSDIDPSTATESNVTMQRNFDEMATDIDIDVDGKTMTVTAPSGWNGGVKYDLGISEGLKSTGGVAFAKQTRSFTTTGVFEPEGALAHWTFEQNGNDVIGAYDAVPADIIDVAWVDSRNAAAGKAASFNGTTSIMEVANGDDFANTKDFTVSLWVKADTTAHPPGGQNFVLGVGGLKGFQIELSPKTAKMAAQYDLGGGLSDSEDTWIDAKGDLGWKGWTFSKNYGPQGLAGLVHNKWLHLVFTYTASTKIGAGYINGELAKTFDFNKWDADAPKHNVQGMTFKSETDLGDKLAFGFLNDRSSTYHSYGIYSNTDAFHLKGQLDDVRIYDRAVSAAEIGVAYNSEKP